MDNGKDDYIPKIRIQGWRKAQWQSAWRMAMRENPDMSFIDWIRSSCDAAAAAILEGRGQQPKDKR